MKEEINLIVCGNHLSESSYVGFLIRSVEAKFWIFTALSPLFHTPKRDKLLLFCHSTWTPSVVHSKNDTSNTPQMGNEVAVANVD